MKRGTWIMTMAMLAAAAVAANAQTSAQFFASQVVRYSPGPGNSMFPNSQLALGGPQGAVAGWGSLHVVTLGVQGGLVLGFDANQVLTNGAGADLVVFENPFGSATLRFCELVRVGVSSNGSDFAFFPTWCGITEPVGPGDMIDPREVSGFAGVNPVLANVVTNTRNPFNPAEGGGDAFDLSALTGDGLVASGKVNLSDIRFVLLKDVLGDGSEHDSHGNPIYDPTGGTIDPDDPDLSDYPPSADIDAIAVINGLVITPLPGDANHDGVVDGADYTLWADHFSQTGATWEMGDFNGDYVVNRDDYDILKAHYGLPGGAMAPAPPALALLAAGAAAVRPKRR